jgi:hypothetical protein
VIQTFGGEESSSPWHLSEEWFHSLFLDNSGTAISSLELPHELAIADWPDAHYIQFEGTNHLEGEESTSYLLRAELTTIQRVPDSGSTVMLLGIALSFGLLLRISRTGQQQT